MDLGFRGEVVDFYHRFRRGYPPTVIDSRVDAFELTTDDVVMDLGCGTGQLTLPIAERVRSVVAVDPEPDMLRRAQRAASEHGVTNVSWILGSDKDVPTLGARRLGAVTIGQALHWMNHEELFRAVVPFLRPGGGVAVLSNGTPLWLQDDLSPEQVVGGVYSALPVDRLPLPEQRPRFAEQLGQAIEPHRPFTERISVTILTGRIQPQ